MGVSARLVTGVRRFNNNITYFYKGLRWTIPNGFSFTKYCNSKSFNRNGIY